MKKKLISKKNNINLLDKIDRPSEISIYYGFSPIKGLTIEKDDENNSKILNYTKSESLHSDLEEKSSILRNFLENNFKNIPFPVCIYLKRPFKGQKNNKKILASMDIIGSSKSVNEAILIKSAISILEEEGFRDIEVEINSIGDRESFSKFEKEVSLFIKKNINIIPSDLKKEIQKNPINILRKKDKNFQNIQEDAPKSISFLSEQSRQSFKEVLEFLETMKINYKINHCLLGEKYHSHTIFEIKGRSMLKKDKIITLAVGGRYNNLSKKIKLKKDIPAIGINLSYTSQRKNSPIKKRLPAPKAKFIQISQEAKLRSLEVIEILRKSGIRIIHSLTKEKIIGQMSQNNPDIEHLIIMGQKEALENSVVIRNLNTMAQDIVKINDLPKYFKNLKK